MINICWTLTFAIAYIFHIDAPNQIASWLADILTNGKIKHIELRKPFGCPLCLTFWTTLIILLCTSPQYWYMSLLLAFLSKYFDYGLTILELLLDKAFLLLEKLLNKIK